MQCASGQVEAKEERPNTQNSCVCVKWINTMGVVGILALKECFPFTLFLLLPVTSITQGFCEGCDIDAIDFENEPVVYRVKECWALHRFSY
eukprot:6462268-Amphidinium_carterae.1